MFPWEIKYSLNLSVLAYFGYSYLYTFVIYLYHNLQNSRISRGLEGMGIQDGNKRGRKRESEEKMCSLFRNVKNKQRRTRQREQLIWLSHFACFFVSVFTSLCVCHVIIENQREQEQKNKSFYLDTFKSYLDVKKKRKKKRKNRITK